MCIVCLLSIDDFSTLVNISVKLFRNLFFREKKAFFYSPLFRTIMAMDWSRSCISRVATLKRFRYVQMDYPSPCWMVIK